MSLPPTPECDTGAPSPAPGDSPLADWLHLANLQLSARLTAALLERFHGDPAAIFAAGDAELELVPGWMERHHARLRDPALAVTDRHLRWFSRYGVRLVTYDDPRYPGPLREIPDPPPMIFVRGTLPSASTGAVAIVGSRRATPYGRCTAERIARELAEAGVPVISGGAMGIDTAAHRGAVSVGGATVAVLGCGLDIDYPHENVSLFEQIVSSGALISEYPLGAQPEAWRFPSRNRIISGLSSAIVVVEAPERSGALITARCAAEHGRTVMAVPSNIDRTSGTGSNALLKDGALLVTETEDVLRALGLVIAPARKTDQRTFEFALDDEVSGAPARRMTAAAAPPPGALTIDLPEIQMRLLALLSDTPRHIDSLATELGIGAAQAGVELTLLELSGFIRRLPGSTYIRSA